MISVHILASQHDARFVCGAPLTPEEHYWTAENYQRGTKPHLGRGYQTCLHCAIVMKHLSIPPQREHEKARI